MTKRKQSIESICPICGRTHEIKAPVNEIRKYYSGYSAKESFKSLTSKEIERIVTHLCEECQKEVFQI